MAGVGGPSLCARALKSTHRENSVSILGSLRTGTKTSVCSQNARSASTRDGSHMLTKAILSRKEQLQEQSVHKKLKSSRRCRHMRKQGPLYI